MDLSQETVDFLRESVDYTLGLPVCTQTLQLKLRASEEAQHHHRNQCLHLQSKLKEKDEISDRSRAEASMNAQALKKFVEENQKLAMECANLLGQCKRWERECSLYDHDREALMDFGNEADERAKEAEVRIRELEEEVKSLSEELQFYKFQYDAQSVGTSAEDTATEQMLLESLLASAIGKDDVMSTAHSFLEANRGVDIFERMLSLCNSLMPSTQKVLALVAELKSFEKDKEHLRVNLDRAEEEVKVLFEENNILDKKNKKLMRQLHRERNMHGSGGKHSGSVSSKSNKRKSSTKMCSQIGKKIDFSDAESLRQPLTPLKQYSPESRNAEVANISSMRILL